MTPELKTKYRIDERDSITGRVITLWHGDLQMGCTYQLLDGNWTVESSRHHAVTTFADASPALDRIVFDWEGCQIESGRLGEWVIDRMSV